MGNMFYKWLKKEFKSILRSYEGVQESSKSTLLNIALLEADVRTSCFRLEGLLRLLIKADSCSKKKMIFLENFLADTKSLEDALGRTDELLAFHKILQQKKQFVHSDKIQQEIMIQAKEVQVLAQRLISYKKFFKSSTKDLQFLRRMKKQKSLKIVHQTIAQEIKKIVTKTSEKLLPEIEAKSLSYDIMEYSFHEFRRNLRWIPIYMHTLKNVYVLSPFLLKNKSEMEKMILRKYKGNRFAELPYISKNVSREKMIDRYAFYTFSHYIALAGLLKDRLETHYHLLELKLADPISEELYKQEMLDIMIDFLESDTSLVLYDNLLFS